MLATSAHDLAGLSGPALLQATLGIDPSATGVNSDEGGTPLGGLAKDQSKMYALGGVTPNEGGDNLIKPPADYGTDTGNGFNLATGQYNQTAQTIAPAAGTGNLAGVSGTAGAVVGKGTYATAVSPEIQALFDADAAGKAAGTIQQTAINSTPDSYYGNNPPSSVASAVTGTASTTAAAGNPTEPNWNSLTVGQTVNGGKVLDASVFQSQFIDPTAVNGVGYTSKYGGAAQFGSASSSTDSIGLGNALGSNSNIYLAGFKPTDYGSSAFGTENNYTPATWNQDALLADATKYGVDASQFGIAASTEYSTDAGTAPVVTPATYDFDKLNAAVQGAEFQKAAADPNAVFLVDSQAVGSDSHLSRNLTSYVKRGDRLVPIANQSYSDDSELASIGKGVAPLAGIALSAFLGPEMAAFFGTGAAGAAAGGAVTGAITSGISGGNVLTGALTGAATAGVGSAAGSAITGLGGSAGLAKTIAGAASSIAGGVASGAGVSLDGILKGAAGGAISGYNVGGSPIANAILKNGIGQIITSGGGKK